MSENNRIRIRETPADRGMLLDRKGRILAHNRPSFEALLVPEDLEGNPEVLPRVREILKLSPEEFQQKLKPAKVAGSLQTPQDQNRYRLAGTCPP